MIPALGDNLDFACFAGFVSLFLLVKHLLFHQNHSKRYFAIDVAFGLLSLVAAWVLLEVATIHESRYLRQSIAGLAPTYALETERLGHAEINERRPDPEQSAYLRILEAQVRWLQANPQIANIFTARKRCGNRIVIIVDSEKTYQVHDPRAIPAVPIGQAYPIESAGFRLAWRGSPNFEETPVVDQRGRWVNAWHPLHDANGDVEAVLGVSYDGERWEQTIRIARLRVFLGVGLVSGLFWVLTGIVSVQQTYRFQQQVSERALRHSEERLALHLRQTPFAAIEWDLHFIAREWNPSAERIFGVPAREAIGRSGYDLIIPEAMEARMRELWPDLVQRGVSRSLIIEGELRSGRFVICECVYTPLIGPDKTVIGVASLAQDIRERRDLEDELRQSQKLQSFGNFASVIAHDFNNTLSVIQGHTELLIGTPGLPPEARESADEIYQAIRKAGTLTRQLLSFSRKYRMKPEPLAPNQMVERVLRAIMPVIGPDIEVRTELGGELPLFQGDPTMIEQALINLILNARDAMPGGGVLRVATSHEKISREMADHHPAMKPGEFVCFTVEDTGTGIAPEHLKQIFEPFFTTKPAGKGTGLGLAAVYGTITQHHGWIHPTSQPGHGSRFMVLFPVALPS